MKTSISDKPFAVAIVGTGNMGGAMAANLLARGWEVHVFDCVEEKIKAMQTLGAQGHTSAAQAACAAQALIVCVVDAAQTEAVLFGPEGAAAAMQPGQLVMLTPTIAPEDTVALAMRLQACQLAVLDTPMSGGPARARDGSMSLMVAGRDAVFDSHRRLLQDLSSQIFRVGERIGDGARTKLVNNLAAGINLVGAAEVLALARRMGLDGNRTLDVMERSSGQSWIGSDRMRRALSGDWAPRAHMTLLEKDTRLAVQAAQALGFDSLLGELASRVFAQASASGLDELDDAAVLRWFEGESTIRP